MRQLRAVAVAIAICAAGTVTAGNFSSNSISPLATLACEFVTSATDCGFSLQAAAANRATNAGPGVDVPTGAELTTLPGDANIAGSGTNERTDLSLGPSSSYCNQGQEEWWAHSVMFPPSYVMPPQSAGWNWGVVFDFHHTGPTGQPNFEIASVPAGLELNVAGGASVVNLPTDPGYYSIALGPVTPNVWYNFMYHIKWSSGSDGLFQAWLNGQQVMNYSGANLYVGESCYLKLANYHTPLGVTETVIHSRIVQGTSQLAVELPVSPPPVTVAVAPATATVQTGGSQALTATVANTTNTTVTWQVGGVVGGNGTVGTISSSGVYTAPSVMPSPATVTVTAVSVADPTRSGAAQVTLTAAPTPVGVSVAPGTASLQTGASQTFSATVTNTSNTAVTWQVSGVTGGNSTIGAISSSGVYTAPSVVPSPATVTVTAVSVADPTRSGSAQVTIATAPAPVSVSVAPGTASLQTGASQTFSATVTNTSNTAVTWQVNGVTGGNSKMGAISTSGVYTTPSLVPSPATVTVTAVSAADPTRSGSALATIMAAPPPPAPVSVSVAPGTASLQTGASQSFTANVTNASNAAVTWQVDGVDGGNATAGTISSSGVYTAPAAVPSPAAVTVTAVSVADPTQSGAALATITAAAPPPPPVSVSIAPGIASLQTGASQEFTATVTNTTNAMVTWQVNGVAGGSATVGVITTSGVYSAPSLVPSPATVTLTAVSAADPMRSGAAQVTITAPQVTITAPSPSGSGGGGSVDSLTLLACALAVARAHRRRRTSDEVSRGWRSLPD
jgi:hypothetical protein